jgi:hypothetical protein
VDASLQGRLRADNRRGGEGVKAGNTWAQGRNLSITRTRNQSRTEREMRTITEQNCALAALDMCLSQVPIWATFRSGHACSVGPCRRTWCATSTCSSPQLCHVVRIPKLMSDWGLMGHQRWLVRCIWQCMRVGTTYWSGGSLFMGFQWLLHSHTSKYKSKECMQRQGCGA